MGTFLALAGVAGATQAEVEAALAKRFPPGFRSGARAGYHGHVIRAALIGVILGLPLSLGAYCLTDPPREVRLRPGQAADVEFGWPVALGACDDQRVVRSEQGERGKNHVRLVALAEGRTRCGYWFDPRCPPRVTVHVVVGPR